MVTLLSHVRSLSLLTLLAVASCTVPEPVLEGRACDGAHPCARGYDCQSGQCVAQAQGDGGLPAGDAGETCTGTQTRPCGSDEGECVPGTQSCQNGTWGSCQGATGPSTEVCDDLDNDCDGKTDSDDPDLVTAACPLQKGVCANSRKGCSMGEEDDCDVFSYGDDYEEGAEQSCDGLDNDCDGTTDEDLDNDGDGWGVDVVCKQGNGDCDDWDAEVYPGATELCNGRDDSCDGAADEGAGMTCVAGAVDGPCALPGADAGAQGGVLTCNSLCSAEVCTPPREICNGLDDDGDGAPDQGLAGDWAHFELAGTQPSSPAVAGVPGTGFTAAWRVEGGSEVRMSRMQAKAAFNDEAPVVAGTGATGAVAVTATHVVWLESKGVAVRRLQRGLPAGETLRQSLSAAPTLMAVRDADLGTGTSALAVASGSTLKVYSLKNNLSPVTFTSSVPDLAGASGLALAKESGTSANLVVYAPAGPPDGGKLKAIAGTNAPHVWSPSSLTDCSSPVGAGSAVAFRAAENGKGGIYIGRALDRELAAGEWVAMTSGTEATDQPALAALSDTEYLVSWLETPAAGGTLVNTKRIRWMGSAWSTPSSPTGWRNPEDQGAAVVAAAAGSEGTRYLVLFETRGATFDMVARTTCPAGL
ncbi:MAG: putative metal-binding motif-containing protein [Myxococcales bacterium]